MEGGWFDAEAIEQERFDADIEQAAYVAEGNRYWRRVKATLAAKAAGDLAKAAGLCPHGGGRTISFDAADPAYGKYGPGAVRCGDCGSVLSNFGWDGPVTVLEPCSGAANFHERE